MTVQTTWEIGLKTVRNLTHITWRIVFEWRLTGCTNSITVETPRFIRLAFTVTVRMIIFNTLSADDSILTVINAVFILDNTVILEKSELILAFDTFCSFITETIRVDSDAYSFIWDSVSRRALDATLFWIFWAVFNHTVVVYQSKRSNTILASYWSVFIASRDKAQSSIFIKPERSNARDTIASIINATRGFRVTFVGTWIIEEGLFAFRTEFSVRLSLMFGVGQTILIFLSTLSINQVVIWVTTCAKFILEVHLPTIRNHFLAPSLI